MSSFDVQAFVEAPSRRLLENCRKSDLQQVAAHFSLLVPKQLTKDALRQFVLDFLVAQEILPPVSRPPSPLVTTEEERMEKPEQACSSESSSPQPSPSSSPLTGARLKLRLARLHIEAEERALERKLRHEIELKRLDADIRLQELELTLQSRKRDPATVRTVQPAEDSDAAISPPLGDVRPQPETPLTPTSSPPPFDISKCLTLLPPFRETEVDGYFLAFERMAAILRWPRDVWPLLLTCKLTGKALQVVSALSLTDSANYDTVKSTVLHAYELVPEAYRQRFRSETPRDNQSYVEYAHNKSVLFEKWCVASQVTSLAELKELILLEEFKRHVPERLVHYLNEQKVTSFSEAALLADQFSLTHRVKETRSEPVRGVKPPPKLRPATESSECFYCHKRGHVIRDCYALKQKNRRNGNSPRKTRPEVALCSLNPCAGINVTKPNPCYKPFLSEGRVSLPGSATDEKVVILRDTGASQTLIKKNVLPFSEMSRAGYSVILQGIEMRTVTAEVHQINLSCSLVSGVLAVAVVDDLPMKGVDLILGNDAAGGLVVPVPELVTEPEVQESTDSLPACVLTRAQAKRDPDITLQGSVLSKLFSDSGKPPDSAVCVSPQVTPENFPMPCDALVEAQNSDKTLKPIRSLACGDSEYASGSTTLLCFILALLLLLSAHIPNCWTSGCNLAFLALRDLLCCAPVLTAPDLSRPFKLEVDASDAGAGAVLLQEDTDGLDHPICYFSRKFNPAQRNYSTIEKETLALIWSLQHFSVYVGNSAFTTIVFTDHNPLVFLHRMYNHNQRLMRWALLLQEFNLDIRHKKGTENLMADALSRSFTLEAPL
uniref:CCHC-type domain-containing protein n=1 Tax=Nothobranchius rachovii TaxID=451742 RepID=A0A1A8P496_9TELE